MWEKRHGETGICKVWAWRCGHLVGQPPHQDVFKPASASLSEPYLGPEVGICIQDVLGRELTLCSERRRLGGTPCMQ